MDKPKPASNVRLSVNISPQTAEQLKWLAEQNQTSVTNVIRRAVGVYSFLEEQLADDANSLMIKNSDKNEVTTLAIL